MEHSGSANSSIAGTSGRSVALEIDLNEAPLPSPRESAASGAFAAEHRCGSCGEVEGAMVVCGDCGRRFHVACLGVREEQREWKCFECLIKCRSGRAGSGLFDMNASPPREADGVEEGFFVNSELVLAASFPKLQDLRRNPFLGFTLSSPMAHPDTRFITTGFSSQNMTRLAHINLETATQKGNLVYLQALKDYISEKRGVLGDGWRVKFEYSTNTCKTYAIYFSPDGTRFGSMSEVAHYLGLISAFNSFETEDKGSNVIILQKGSHSSKRTKEKRAKNMVRNAMDIHSESNGSKLFHDGFPVQFEDFFVMSVGKIDPRASFHNNSQIWPAGYRSIWHDKYTGSIFVYDVLDGGDSGPVFRVHRYPCNNYPIPYASKVLCISNCAPNHTTDETFYNDNDDDANIHMMLTDDTQPPHLDVSSWKIASLTAKVNINLQKLDDVIGEFSVEERSLSSAWQKAVETLLNACNKSYQNKNILTFCCKHRVNEHGASYNFDSLKKFSFLAGPINSIPDKIVTVKDLEFCCQVLREWLEVDRFGLDLEFVQELIEQLPGVDSCSKYKSLSERCQGLSSQTVGSGFFKVVRKDGLQNEAVANSLGRTNKRPGPPGNPVTSNLPPHLIGDVMQAYEICLRFYEVLGLNAPISRQLLENELMNPWVENSKPLKKNMIVTPCELTRQDEDLVNTSEEHEKDGSRAEAASKCSGAELAKIHMTLLKVVIEDVLTKVKEIFDPFGGVESRSRKSRRKDTECVVGGKRMNLDMFPVNEFTWPELARRYILVALCTDGNLESSEVLARECGKVFHCLYGDGGILCGSLTGVAAMEADAMVLAEASKKIFSCLTNKGVDFIIDQKEMDTGDSTKETNANANVIDDESPEWAQALEPVRKLPTNVGARIRRCIHDSLNKNPPEWAKDILEHSISKEVYKGNASGPTKRAVISVLEKVREENPQQKPAEKKEKEKEKEKGGVTTLSDAVMKRCRTVLRTVASADDDRIFFNLLAKTNLKPNDPDDTGVLGYPAMVSRPLDFRTIDLRLAAGFYVASHESFIEDVREVWQNLRVAYRERPDFIELVETLSKKFEESYEQEVVNLVNKITDTSNSLDSSNEEEKKDIILEIMENTLPPAPWEDGVCKVCGMDKDDDSVLLCDKCDSEYHTYCLDPPLARIPDGNWYCPSCTSTQIIINLQDQRCGARVLCGKRKFQKEFTRNLLEKLAPLADAMELTEYWELGVEERVFFFKFLCDEVLSCGVVRNHLSPDSGDLEKTLRKLYKELKSQIKKEDILTSNLPKQVDFTKSSDSQSQIQNEENDENRPAGQDQELVSDVKNTVSSLQEKIADLESKIAKPVIRREFLGRDLVGRLYWALNGPDWVVVTGPHGRRKTCATSSSFLSRLNECEMPEIYPSDDSLWTCYESEPEIQQLIGWLRDGDSREKELKETIKQWQLNRENDHNTPEAVEEVNHSSSSGYGTKARAALETKFGSFCEQGAIIQYLKKQSRKGKMVNKGNWYRCDCLELVGSTRNHCSSCHLTFLTNEELEGHNDGKCENRQEPEIPSKSRKIPLVKPPALTDYNDDPDSPFVFEEIRAKFCTRGSLKEEVKDIGLIGSNGIPSFVLKSPPQTFDADILLVSGTKKWFNSRNGSTDLMEKQGPNETPSKSERLKPRGTNGKSSLKNKTPVRICQSSLKPLTGRVLEILRVLKINLFDIEAAIPNEGLRPSRGGLDRIRAWRAFVKSAQSIYEMVQATIILEDMIKSDYLRKEWWYWSSQSTAAKISNISALSLRIYALDSAIYYQKPPVDPTEPITPKASKSEKSNPKDSSEKSNQRSSSSPVTDSKPAEPSRPKTRSKKRMRDSDS